MPNFAHLTNNCSKKSNYNTHNKPLSIYYDYSGICYQITLSLPFSYIYQVSQVEEILRYVKKKAHCILSHTSINESSNKKPLIVSFTPLSAAVCSNKELDKDAKDQVIGIFNLLILKLLTPYLLNKEDCISLTIQAHDVSRKRRSA